MTGSLNIIEPTLTGQAGHCYSFITSLCSTDAKVPLTVWCDRHAQITLPGHVTINRFFYRKFRRLQALWLYRKLMKANERIFISTAGRTDLILLDLASKGKIPPHQVFLYVHWFKATRDKQDQLAKLARRQPEIVVLTPSPSVCAEFRKAGFINTRIVPYPITRCKPGSPEIETVKFRHLLFAGAARRDKG